MLLSVRCEKERDFSSNIKVTKRSYSSAKPTPSKNSLSGSISYKTYTRPNSSQNSPEPLPLYRVDFHGHIVIYAMPIIL